VSAGARGRQDVSSWLSADGGDRDRRQARRGQAGGHYTGDRHRKLPPGHGDVRRRFGRSCRSSSFNDLDEAIAWANDSIYGLASSIFTKSVDVAMRAANELRFGETYVNRENMENMQGFHAGWRTSGIGGADGKHGVLEYTRTHVVYLQYDMAAGRP
jgi:hypothetical protein